MTRVRRLVFAVSLLASATATRASAQGLTQLVSRGTDGVAAVGENVGISQSGRYVVFRSASSNLAGAITYLEIFLFDRTNGKISRVSVPASLGAATDGNSSNPTVSADGRYVAFESQATTLVTPDVNNTTDVFLHDTVTHETLLVSFDHRRTDGRTDLVGGAIHPSISGDGRSIVFEANSLANGDNTVYGDIYVRAFAPALDGVSPSTASIAGGTSVTLTGTDLRPGGQVTFGGVAATQVTVDSVSSGTARAPAHAAGTMSVTFRNSEGAEASLYGVLFAAEPCTFTISPKSVTISADAGTGTVAVTASAATCAWTAISNASWISLTAGTPGTGSGKVAYAVSQNPLLGNVKFSGTPRSGSLTIAGQTLSVNQSDRLGCRFSLSETQRTIAATGGTATVSLFEGTGNFAQCMWTATTTSSWITITSPTSGAGGGGLTVSVPANTGPQRTGIVTIAGLTFAVTQPPLAPAPAFGTLDTPVNNSTGLNGSIAVTGWALDDIEVTEVQVWRDPHPSDPPGAVFGGPAPQGGKVFVGYASLVNGARPDVETLYPTYPFKSRAGWGYLLLTRGLVWEGKGLFKLYAIAADKDGHLAQLGSTTISLDNASATKPFGAIDTPGQGATARGMYPNTGWVLTPNSGATIAADKVQVAIDGVFLPGTLSMSDRTDISGGFPQFTTTGAGRGLFIDTTQYSDGAHTIGWLVTDSSGKADGVGSRFFTVANGTSALTVAGAEPSAMDLDGLPLDASALRMRRGWDADADLSFVDADAAGRIVLVGEELDRLEVRLDELGDAAWTGYQRVGEELRPLPTGSHLDPHGTFTWQPGVGFVGTYDLVFVRTAGGGPTSRRDVRIVLHPQGRLGRRVEIDRR